MSLFARVRQGRTLAGVGTVRPPSQGFSRLAQRRGGVGWRWWCWCCRRRGRRRRRAVRSSEATISCVDQDLVVAVARPSLQLELQDEKLTRVLIRVECELPDRSEGVGCVDSVRTLGSDVVVETRREGFYTLVRELLEQCSHKGALLSSPQLILRISRHRCGGPVVDLADVRGEPLLQPGVVRLDDDDSTAGRNPGGVVQPYCDVCAVVGLGQYVSHDLLR